MTQRVALKIDVDTLRGTIEGVPSLIQLLQHHRVNATFLFSLGPDNTGRAVRRAFRRGFVRKVLRTSVVAHYGLKTLCYGTILPAPHIGVRGRDVMRSVSNAGFEVGIHCYDHVAWQDNVATRDYAWTRRQMELAVDCFQGVFGTTPRTHGAAGWQMNEHVPALEAEFGFDYASDTRGTEPFWPALGRLPVRCAQLPTTLPTFDELIGVSRCTEANVAARVLERSANPTRDSHVFTLHAELEGMKLRPAFEHLLQLWLERGVHLCSMRELYLSHPGHLSVCAVRYAGIPGRSGRLACQGEPQ